MAIAGCSLVVETEVKKGISSTCTSADECQGEGALCQILDGASQGVCTAKCSDSGQCPSGTTCGQDNFCLTPINVGAIFIGNSAEGWTKTHSDGLDEAGRLG